MKNLDYYIEALRSYYFGYKNARTGWKTTRHIVVIESDDWGSMRMPSKEAFNALLAKGIRVDKCHYCSYDSLESEDDLCGLFEVLNSVKDCNNHPAVLTANVIVANPDFEKIKNSDFRNYYFKRIDETFSETEGSRKVLDLWREGCKGGFFRPQSHGREHLNIGRWMGYLRGNYPETRYAFDWGVFGISTTITSEKRRSFLPAFDFEDSKQEEEVSKIALSGLDIFEQLFSFRSRSFIAPNYTNGAKLNAVLKNAGVDFIQGAGSVKQPNPDTNNYVYKYRRNGEKESDGTVSLVRNVFFEPSENLGKDWVGSALKEIDKAFKLKAPVIIGSHRVNYISRLDQNNRDRSIRLLSKLLSDIVSKWPDVEFLSSDQLGEIIISQ